MGQPCGLQLGQGQVVALAGQVAAEVLPEVDELQRGANVVALRQQRGLGDAIQVQQQPPHGVGRQAAVVQQLGVVGVALAAGGAVHVLLKGAQQVVQQVQRQLVRVYVLCQRAKHPGPAGVGALGVLRGMVQGLAVGGQVGQALRGGGIALVGDVVGRAGKPIDGGNHRAQVWRAQPGRDRKVFFVCNTRFHGGDCPHPAGRVCDTKRVLGLSFFY